MAPPEPTDSISPPPPGGPRRGSVCGVLAKEGIRTHIALVETPTDFIGPAVIEPFAEHALG